MEIHWVCMLMISGLVLRRLEGKRGTVADPSKIAVAARPLAAGGAAGKTSGSTSSSRGGSAAAPSVGAPPAFSTRTAPQYQRQLKVIREKIAHSFKNIFRPKIKFSPPELNRLMVPKFNTGGTNLLPSGQLVLAGYAGYELAYANALVNYYQPYRSRFRSPAGLAGLRTECVQLFPVSSKALDVCFIHRLNWELPLSEIPNIVLDLLTKDEFSGPSIEDKAKFVTKFFIEMRDNFKQANQEEKKIFEIPPGTDMSVCKFSHSSEPFSISSHHILSLYSSESNSLDLIDELTEAAKACLPGTNTSLPKQTYPCLDYAIDPSQVLHTTRPYSIFHNDDLCSRYLSPSLFDCISAEHKKCTLHHLLTINMFARNFYVCSEAIDRESATLLQDEDYMRKFEQKWINGSSGLSQAEWSIIFYLGVLLITHLII